MKHINSIILTLLTILFALTASAQDFEYDGLWYTILDSDAKTVKTKDGFYDSERYEANSGNKGKSQLIIPEKVSDGQQEYVVVEIGFCGFSNQKEIHELSLPSTITQISGYAFEDCTNMLSIHLPSSLKTIEEKAFSGCYALTSIEFPQGLESIGKNAFARCTGLVSLNLPTTVTYIGESAFYDCIGVVSVVIPAAVEVLEKNIFDACFWLHYIYYDAAIPVAAPEDIFNTSGQNTYAIATLIMPNASLDDIKSVTPWNNFVQVKAKDGMTGFDVGSDDFEYEGIWYTIENEELKTCRTKDGKSVDNASVAVNYAIGDLVIPETVSNGKEDYTVVCIGRNSFAYLDKITSVSLPSSVLDIQSGAFASCKGIQSIILPEALRSIGSQAFFQCSSLTEIELPESLTSIGTMAFDACSSLEEIKIPHKITTISWGMFNGCKSLKSVIMPDGVTSIGNQAFLYCDNLKSINMPSSLSFIGYRAFDGCGSLESLDLPESLSEMENSAFYGCSSLTSLSLPSSLKRIETNSFNGCASLTSVVIPEGVRELGIYSFKDCSSLVILSIPSTLVSIEQMAFDGCPLNTVEYIAVTPIESGEDIFDVTSYRQATLNTPNARLASVQSTIPWNKFLRINASDGSVEPGLAAGDDFEYEGIWYTVIDAEAKTVKTKEGDFDYDNQICYPGNRCVGDLVIPANVSDGSFNYTVVEIGSWGFGDNDITSVSLPQSLTTLSPCAFHNCIALTSVQIPNGVTEIGASVFCLCDNLQSVILPESINTLGSQAFGYCYNLRSINLPESLHTIEYGAFMCCNSLESIFLSDNITEIPADAFAGCGLNSISLPKNLTSIDFRAFGGCNNLTSIELPESLTILGENVFEDCSNLNSVTLPGALISIGDYAFKSCFDLTNVTYNAESPISCNENVFDVYSSAILNTPNATLASVQSTTPWNKFLRINASDGSVEPGLAIGDDFEYEGIWYTVIDADAKTCKTREGIPNNDWTVVDGGNGTSVSGDISIPSTVSDGLNTYTVVEIGGGGFFMSPELSGIIIPETVKLIGESAFLGCKSLRTIDLPNSLDDIRSFAFFDCSALENIRIPDSIKSIGYGLLDGCTSLKTVVFPDSLKVIYSWAFNGCSSLITINLPTSLVKIEQNAFSGCSALKSIDLPASLEEIGEYAFGGCNELMSVSYQASSPVTASENVFDDVLYEKATLNMPNATLATIQAILPWKKFLRINASDGSVAPAGEGDDFEYGGIWYTVIDEDAKTCKTKSGYINNPGNICAGDLVIPDVVSDGFNDYSVVGIGMYSFKDCTEITSISLPNTLIFIENDAFFGCSSLSSIILPSSLEEIGSYFLASCSALTEITIPEKVTKISWGAFDSCRSLAKVILPENLTEIEVNAFIGCYSLASVNMPASLKRIGGSAFSGCALPSIELPGSLEYIEEWAFVGNPLTTVTYLAENLVAFEESIFSGNAYYYATLNTPNATLASVQSTIPWNKFLRINASDGSVEPGLAAGEDFEYEGIWYTVIDPEVRTCRTKIGDWQRDDKIPGNIVSGDLIIPETVSDGNNDYKVVEIGYCGFINNTELTSIHLPESIEFMGGEAFRNCVSLKEINIPHSVSEINEYLLAECRSLSSIDIPDSVERLCLNAFYGCWNLRNIVIPNSVVEIEGGVFWDCTSLTEIHIPNSVTSIGTAAFQDCDNLAEVTLPNSITELRERTFNYCHSLQSIEIPESVTQIGSECFRGCSSLGSIYIPESVTVIGPEAFAYCKNLNCISFPTSLISIGKDVLLNCNRLTSIAWMPKCKVDETLLKYFNNPNLLLYVEDAQYAPEGMTANIVVDGVCDNLVLTPGFAFSPLYAFTAEHSEITKSFTQQTPVGGCAGWETLAIPFEPTSITVSDGRALVPFSAFTDIDTQCPFWLYEADAAGEWKEASAIHQGVPYILAMPNNDEYADQYRVDGEVTFLTDEETLIAPETCAPYVTTWNSGREFRSLWLPLSASEAADAMGLNVGISNLTGDDGKLLAPGSAFHTDVLPKPLEAYVTRIDGRRAMPVRGDQSFLTMLGTECGLRITTDSGSIILSSDLDRTVEILTMDGIIIRRAYVKAGEPYHIDNLTRGIYIVAGSKITVK